MGNLYRTDEYIKRHPTLHKEDSPWKIDKIIPLLDTFFLHFFHNRMNLLDVGGGAGHILAGVSSYIEEEYRIEVNKYALDLSPGMLEIQKKRNPQLKKALNEDIQSTSLYFKEIDLALLIDLIEHIPDPIKALEKVKRISRYAIFKVPLDTYLVGELRDMVRGRELREKAMERIGHINAFTYCEVKDLLEKHTGLILAAGFTNVHEYYLDRGQLKGKSKLTREIGRSIFKYSPRLAAALFGDFAMFLVKCY